MTKHAQRKRTRSAPPATKATKTTRAKKATAKKTAKATRKTAKPTAAEPTEPAPQRPRDPRLPAAGTTLIRPDKGREIRVVVLDAGFRWEGSEYRSLSALAAKVTGAKSINGMLWFRVTDPKPAKPKASKRAGAAPKKAAQEPTPTTETPTV